MLTFADVDIRKMDFQLKGRKDKRKRESFIEQNNFFHVKSL